MFVVKLEDKCKHFCLYTDACEPFPHWLSVDKGTCSLPVDEAGYSSLVQVLAVSSQRVACRLLVALYCSLKRILPASQ